MAKNLLKQLALIDDYDCKNITRWLSHTGRYDLIPNSGHYLSKIEVAFLDINTIRKAAVHYDKTYNLLPDRNGTVSYTRPTWDKLFPGERP